MKHRSDKLLMEIVTASGTHSYADREDAAHLIKELAEKLQFKATWEPTDLQSVWYFKGERIKEVRITFDEPVSVDGG